MKKTLILAVALIFSCTALFAQAQTNPMAQPLPNDPNMRIGKLENGLSYYIMKNSKPENTANFHIITNVGAVQETDPQDGLAHFLEHMALNGIGIFPNELMLEYLQNNGLTFGGNINAQTGFDDTQYFLKDIPTNRSQGLVDTALLILRDWSSDILLQNEEVDAERGVISEEHRTTQTASKKTLIGRANDFGRGTNYAKRNVIGTLDNLRDFEYSTIRDFYETWYRPSLQAVVIIGDIDVDKMEAEVKRLFTPIQNPENAKPKEKIIVPEILEDYAKIYEYKEHTSTDFWAMAKIDQAQYETNNLFGSEIRRYMFNIINTILNKRYGTIAQSPDSPIANAAHMNNELLGNNEAEMAMATLKPGRELEAIELVAKEINRMSKFGVNNSELRIVKQDLIKLNETLYNNRNNRSNTQIATAAIASFTKNMPILAPDMDYNIAMQLIPSITKEMVNQFIPLLIKNNNKYFLSISTPKATVTKQEIIDAFRKGMNAEVEPIAERVVDTNILDEKALIKGSVVNTEDGLYGSTIWTLSNGAKVIFQHSELKEDELIYSAYKDGGSSLLNDDEFAKSQLATSFINSRAGGVGKYSAMDLADALAGKNANTGVRINNYSISLGGSSSSSDVETLFKLINLNITQPRFDEEDFNTFVLRNTPQIKNWKNSPKSIFGNEVKKKISNMGSERTAATSQEILVENLDKFTIEDVKNTFLKTVNGVDGMTFVFVGNAKAEDIRKYAELYIGSIPAGDKPTKINRTVYSTENTETFFVNKQEDEKATVLIRLLVKGKNTLKEDMVYGILSDILNYRYTEVIREKMGATYGVGAWSIPIDTPEGFARMFIAQYDTNDKQVKASSYEIVNQLEMIAKNGVLHEDFVKAMTAKKKAFIDGQINNSYWITALAENYVYNKESINSFDKIINTITEKDIRKAAKNFLKKAVETKVVMTSAELK